jgi:predicted dehydrogenase
MKRVRFGVIGIGGIGRTHMVSIREMENAELVAISDVNEDLVKSSATEFKVKWFTDYKELIEEDEIDAVSICTPHYLHAPITIDALKAGKHVLCEKPMANHVREADDMISTANQQDLKLGVVADGIVEPDFRRIKAQLDKGELGQVYRAEVLQGGMRTHPYYLRASWRGTWKEEGGACMINQAIHMIDLLPFYLGRPKEVCGWIGMKCHEIEAEDIASALILFENDVPAVLQCNNLEVPHIDRITLLTDRAKIIGDWLGSKKVTKYETGLREYIMTTNEVQSNLKYESIEMEPSKDKFAGIHPANVAAFTDAIIQNKDPIFTADEARTTLEIINGITLSHFSKRRVTLPLDREEYANLFGQLVSGRKSLLSP